MSAICQYHSDTLPRKALQQGLLAHPSIFINETLSRINPLYLHARNTALEPTANRLLSRDESRELNSASNCTGLLSLESKKQRT
jgi:hypothetical protein